MRKHTLTATRKAEVIKLAKLWQSDDGKLAIEQMTKLKNANLDRAMRIADEVAQPAETSLAFLNRARGIQVVLDDIVTIIQASENFNEEGGSNELGD